MDQKFPTVWEKMSENLGGFFLTYTVVDNGDDVDDDDDDKSIKLIFAALRRLLKCSCNNQRLK